MDGGIVQTGHGVPKRVLRCVRDVVSVPDIDGSLDAHVSLGVQTVPDPAQTDPVDLDDARHPRQRPLRVLDKCRVHGIHQAPAYVTSRTPQDQQDRNRD